MKERPRNITPMFRGLSPILLIHFLFFCSCNCLAGCFLFRIFIQNGECNIGCMVRDTLESGYKIGEDHAGFRRTFVAGQTLYMLLLQIPLLVICLCHLQKPHLSFNGITVTCGMRLDPMISYEITNLVFVILPIHNVSPYKKDFLDIAFHTVTLYRPFDHGFFHDISSCLFFVSRKIWLLLFHNTATIMPQIITGRKISNFIVNFSLFLKTISQNLPPLSNSSHNTN